MPTRASIVSIVAVGLWMAAAQPSAQQPIVGGRPAAPLTVQATTTADLRAWDSLITANARLGRLRLRSAKRDPLMAARTVERFEQFHGGVRIWAAEIVRDSEHGVAHSIFGVLAPDLTLSVTPALSVDRAREFLLGAGGPGAVLLKAPQLVIVRLDDGEHRLAYTAVAAGDADVWRVFVDAHSGVELLRYSEIQTQQAVGTGTGVLGDTKKISVQQIGSTYVAFDTHRPPIIETFDMHGNLAHAKLWRNGFVPYSTSDLAADADNVWTDVAAVDAHVHVSLTYDYYFKRFARNGVDGHDWPIDIVVNPVTQQGSLTLSNADFNQYAIGAFWCSPCGPAGRGVIMFGSGLPEGYVLISSGSRWTYTAGALDVAAHELTHAVTAFSSGLIYRNESGALNEAFSDIMGKGVEFFYRPAGGGPGQADYRIGKDVVRSVRSGSLNGIRSMDNPGLFGDPDHYSRRYVGTADNGGVHINSGIANHAFYLAIEGGTNRTSGLSVQGVGGANREQIERVFFRAFTLLMPAGSSFATARAATSQAARDLYGANSGVERAITQAWTAVGVH